MVVFTFLMSREVQLALSVCKYLEEAGQKIGYLKVFLDFIFKPLTKYSTCLEYIPSDYIVGHKNIEIKISLVFGTFQ